MVRACVFIVLPTIITLILRKNKEVYGSNLAHLGYLQVYWQSHRSLRHPHTKNTLPHCTPTNNSFFPSVLLLPAQLKPDTTAEV